MKFGIREVCNIAFKCKTANTKIGGKTLKKGELITYFDSAKTSSLEGSSEAVYARGGRGNPKLITWEGEKTMTFTFEEALLSPTGLALLLSADLTSAEEYLHAFNIKAIAYTDTEDESKVKLDLNEEIHEIAGSEGKIVDPETSSEDPLAKEATLFVYATDENGDQGALVTDVTISSTGGDNLTGNVLTATSGLKDGQRYLVSGYVKKTGSNLVITPDKFSDYVYVEAETLFRRETDGVDLPAQFTIPKGKIASEFNLSMANSGDPSTFTFKLDAMPDYTVSNRKKKVLCEINVAE